MSTEGKEKLYAAIADIQHNIGSIPQSTKGYGYNYADLPAIMDYLQPFLRKNKLVIINQIEGDILTTTIIQYESNQSISSSMSINHSAGMGKMTEIQGLGAVITYVKRYNLVSLLGLTTDDDPDGRVEQEQSNYSNNKQNSKFKNQEKGNNNTKKNDELSESLVALANRLRLYFNNDVSRITKVLNAEYDAKNVSANRTSAFTKEDIEYFNKILDNKKYNPNVGKESNEN